MTFRTLARYVEAIIAARIRGYLTAVAPYRALEAHVAQEYTGTVTNADSLFHDVIAEIIAGGSGTVTVPELNAFTDVTLGTLADGDVLGYRNGMWRNIRIPEIEIDLAKDNLLKRLIRQARDLDLDAPVPDNRILDTYRTLDDVTLTSGAADIVLDPDRGGIRVERFSEIARTFFTSDTWDQRDSTATAGYLDIFRFDSANTRTILPRLESFLANHAGIVDGWDATYGTYFRVMMEYPYNAYATPLPTGVTVSEILSTLVLSLMYHQTGTPIKTAPGLGRVQRSVLTRNDWANPGMFIFPEAGSIRPPDTSGMAFRLVRDLEGDWDITFSHGSGDGYVGLTPQVQDLVDQSFVFNAFDQLEAYVRLGTGLASKTFFSDTAEAPGGSGTAYTFRKRDGTFSILRGADIIETGVPVDGPLRLAVRRAPGATGDFQVSDMRLQQRLPILEAADTGMKTPAPDGFPETDEDRNILPPWQGEETLTFRTAHFSATGTPAAPATYSRLALQSAATENVTPVYGFVDDVVFEFSIQAPLNNTGANYTAFGLEFQDDIRESLDDGTLTANPLDSADFSTRTTSVAGDRTPRRIVVHSSATGLAVKPVSDDSFTAITHPARNTGTTASTLYLTLARTYQGQIVLRGSDSTNGTVLWESLLSDPYLQRSVRFFYATSTGTAYTRLYTGFQSVDARPSVAYRVDRDAPSGQSGWGAIDDGTLLSGGPPGASAFQALAITSREFAIEMTVQATGNDEHAYVGLVDTAQLAAHYDATASDAGIFTDATVPQAARGFIRLLGQNRVITHGLSFAQGNIPTITPLETVIRLTRDATGRIIFYARQKGEFQSTVISRNGFWATSTADQTLVFSTSGSLEIRDFSYVMGGPVILGSQAPLIREDSLHVWNDTLTRFDQASGDYDVIAGDLITDGTSRGMIFLDNETPVRKDAIALPNARRPYREVSFSVVPGETGDFRIGGYLISESGGSFTQPSYLDPDAAHGGTLITGGSGFRYYLRYDSSTDSWHAASGSASEAAVAGSAGVHDVRIRVLYEGTSDSLEVILGGIKVAGISGSVADGGWLSPLLVTQEAGNAVRLRDLRYGTHVAQSPVPEAAARLHDVPVTQALLGTTRDFIVGGTADNVTISEGAAAATTALERIALGPAIPDNIPFVLSFSFRDPIDRFAPGYGPTTANALTSAIRLRNAPSGQAATLFAEIGFFLGDFNNLMTRLIGSTTLQNDQNRVWEAFSTVGQRWNQSGSTTFGIGETERPDVEIRYLEDRHLEFRVAITTSSMIKVRTILPVSGPLHVELEKTNLFRLSNVRLRMGHDPKRNALVGMENPYTDSVSGFGLRHVSSVADAPLSGLLPEFFDIPFTIGEIGQASGIHLFVQDADDRIQTSATDTTLQAARYGVALPPSVALPANTIDLRGVTWALSDNTGTPTPDATFPAAAGTFWYPSDNRGRSGTARPFRIRHYRNGGGNFIGRIQLDTNDNLANWTVIFTDEISGTLTLLRSGRWYFDITDAQFLETIRSNPFRNPVPGGPGLEILAPGLVSGTTTRFNGRIDPHVDAPECPHFRIRQAGDRHVEIWRGPFRLFRSPDPILSEQLSLGTSVTIAASTEANLITLEVPGGLGTELSYAESVRTVTRTWAREDWLPASSTLTVPVLRSVRAGGSSSSFLRASDRFSGPFALEFRFGEGDGILALTPAPASALTTATAVTSWLGTAQGRTIQIGRTGTTAYAYLGNAGQTATEASAFTVRIERDASNAITLSFPDSTSLSALTFAATTAAADLDLYVLTSSEDFTLDGLTSEAGDVIGIVEEQAYLDASPFGDPDGSVVTPARLYQDHPTTASQRRQHPGSFVGSGGALRLSSDVTDHVRYVTPFGAAADYGELTVTPVAANGAVIGIAPSALRLNLASTHDIAAIDFTQTTAAAAFTNIGFVLFQTDAFRWKLPGEDTLRTFPVTDGRISIRRWMDGTVEIRNSAADAVPQGLLSGAFRFFIGQHSAEALHLDLVRTFSIDASTPDAGIRHWTLEGARTGTHVQAQAALSDTALTDHWNRSGPNLYGFQVDDGLVQVLLNGNVVHTFDEIWDAPNNDTGAWDGGIVLSRNYRTPALSPTAVSTETRDVVAAPRISKIDQSGGTPVPVTLVSRPLTLATDHVPSRVHAFLLVNAAIPTNRFTLHIRSATNVETQVPLTERLPVDIGVTDLPERERPNLVLYGTAAISSPGASVRYVIRTTDASEVELHAVAVSFDP